MTMNAIFLYEVYMKWSTAGARENLSRLLRAARDEPQVVTLRGRPVAVVIGYGEYDAYMRWRDSRPTSSLSEILDDLAQVCAAEDYALPLPRRRDRPHPMFDGADG